MSQGPRRLRLLGLLVTVALVIAACGDAASPSPAPQTAAPTATPAPGQTPRPFEPMVYPETAEAPCSQAGYAGNLRRISAVDARTVEFELCNPDAAFLSKIASPALGIHDTASLQAHGADGSLLDQPNGTGPYRLREWSRGSRIVLEAFDGYWGPKPLSRGVELRWSDEAARRLLELQDGSVDGIDNPRPDTIPEIRNNPSLRFYERGGLNVLYVGMNSMIQPWGDVRVRQAIAMGIDRERIVDELYPPGSQVASHFTPCVIPFACEGDDWHEFDPAGARQLLADAGYPEGFDTKIQFQAAVQGYLPDAPGIATEIQQQLLANLGIDASLDLQDSRPFLDAYAAGTLDGLFLLGWGADYPDASNFLDAHFGPGSAPAFGNTFPDLAAAIERGRSSSSDADRAAAYREANSLLRQHVPMAVVAHAGSGTAFQADVTGAHSSPTSNEVFSVMMAGDRNSLVWMQNAEPLSLYCADETDGETLRACAQIVESLYTYEVGGTAPRPALARECVANDELTVWTCALREGVTFHDGSPLDANDVVLSYTVQWDVQHPLRKGRSDAFEYFPTLFGGFLNPQ